MHLFGLPFMQKSVNNSIIYSALLYEILENVFALNKDTCLLMFPATARMVNVSQPNVTEINKINRFVIESFIPFGVDQDSRGDGTEKKPFVT